METKKFLKYIHSQLFDVHKEIYYYIVEVDGMGLIPAGLPVATFESVTAGGGSLLNQLMSACSGNFVHLY